MSDMTVEKAQALLDRAGDYTDQSLECAAPDLARAYIAQAAELARLRARIEAADKLAEAARDTADMALTGEIPDGMFEDDAPDFNRGYDAAIRKVRAALSAYEGSKE